MNTAHYVNRGPKAGKTGFGEGVVLAGRRHSKLIALGADITASVGLDLFAAEFPGRFFSLGIAEQNCVGAAAGLALSGKIPVFSTYGVFAALRAADQIRISLCYNKVHVIIGGAHAGVSVGPDGATHQALEDLAIMRVLPHMTVLSPCDASQVSKAVLAAAEHRDGPVYIRFGREPMPDFSPPDEVFKIGEAPVYRQGEDVGIVATGHLVWEALQAAEELEKQNISARVINLHTIKPLDGPVLLKAARETGAIVCAEEHQQMGGMGSAVAEFLAAHHPVPMAFIGMDDSFGQSGKAGELMDHYGLRARNIVDAVHDVLIRKKNGH